jgi:hypothetical protein
MLPTEELFVYVCVLVDDAIGSGAIAIATRPSMNEVSSSRSRLSLIRATASFGPAMRSTGRAVASSSVTEPFWPDPGGRLIPDTGLEDQRKIEQPGEPMPTEPWRSIFMKLGHLIVMQRGDR